jgi:large subunit ribosomal protein L10
MSKVVKQMMIADLHAKLGDCREVLVVDVSKLNAVATNRWRNGLRKKQIRVLGVKNAVAKRALVDAGLGGIADVLQGPSAIVWGGEDIVALAKEIVDSAKQLKDLQVKGGAIGASSLNAEEVDQLSKSPGRPELLSQVAGLIRSPGGRVAAAVLGAGGRLAGCVQAVAEKAEKAGEPAAA